MRRLLQIMVLTSSILGLFLSTHVSAQFIDTSDLDLASCVPAPNGEEPVLFGGARPTSLVLQETALLSQPPLTPDTEPFEIVAIPANAQIIVFDLDEQTRSYFRVIWPCEGFNFTGWVVAEDVRHSTRRTNPKPAPPGCAKALGVVDLLDDVWTSTVKGKIAVVVDLYRDSGGTVYPQSFYYLTRNGRELRDREREFKSSGPFLINGVVMGADVQVGNQIGFSVITSSDEDLNFFGTLYEVPEGCEFGE